MFSLLFSFSGWLPHAATSKDQSWTGVTEAKKGELYHVGGPGGLCGTFGSLFLVGLDQLQSS